MLGVLAASVLWGTTGTAATFAPAVGPLAIGAAAMGLGGLLQALTATGPITCHRAELHAQRRVVLLGGAAVAVYPLAFYTSMRLAGVAVGTVVSIGSAPLASALAERVIDRRRLTARWMVGAALGLAGMAQLCLAEASRPDAGHAAAGPIMLGAGLGLAAGATYAVYTWAAHRLIGRGVSSHAAMGAVFGMGGFLLLPVLLATGAPLAASWPNAAVGAYLALVPMFTGYLLFGRALARVPASTATTLSLLEPAIATILAVIVVGERLPTVGWVGLTFIAGCLVTLTAPRRSVSAARLHQEPGLRSSSALTPGSLSKPASPIVASSTRYSAADASPPTRRHQHKHQPDARADAAQPEPESRADALAAVPAEVPLERRELPHTLAVAKVVVSR